MAENHYHETRKSGSSTGTLAFIVGGLVVAVGLILYFLFGDFNVAGGSGPADTGTDVNITATSESDAGAADAGAADTGAEAGATAETDAGTADAAAGAEASQ